ELFQYSLDTFRQSLAIKKLAVCFLDVSSQDATTSSSIRRVNRKPATFGPDILSLGHRLPLSCWSIARGLHPKWPKCTSVSGIHIRKGFPNHHRRMSVTGAA